MSPHPKRKSAGPQAHFSREQHELACAFYRSAFKRKRHTSPDPADMYRGGPGCSGDPIWNVAWQDFQAGQLSEDRLEKPIKHRRQFKEVVRRWYHRYSEARACCRQGSSADCDLSPCEIEFCVTTLTTPLQVGESYHYFETIADCIAQTENGDRLSALLPDKQMSNESLHRLLVDKLHVVKYAKCDTREELPDSTLKLRRACADKWAGRAHWLLNPSPTRDARLVKSYFLWEWYFDYTFMIDATSFDDGIHSGKHTQRVYQAVNKVWGPKLQRPKKSLDASSRMMFYVVIHRRGGIIKGPALMFTGSRVPQRLAPQKGIILGPWYAVPQHSLNAGMQHEGC
jgi:hypothetical protein